MKNKYQEALNRIKQISSDDFVDIGGYYAQPKWFEDDIKLIQELVNKETPIGHTVIIPCNSNKEQFKCLNCDFIIREIDYLQNQKIVLGKIKRCPNCGQLLRWNK